MATILDQWLKCRDEVFDDEPEGDLLLTLKLAFFCGASVVVGDALRAPSDRDREARLREFYVELSAYVGELADDANPPMTSR